MIYIVDVPMGLLLKGRTMRGLSSLLVAPASKNRCNFFIKKSRAWLPLDGST